MIEKNRSPGFVARSSSSSSPAAEGKKWPANPFDRLGLKAQQVPVN